MRPGKVVCTVTGDLRGQKRLHLHKSVLFYRYYSLQTRFLARSQLNNSQESQLPMPLEISDEIQYKCHPMPVKVYSKPLASLSLHSLANASMLP